MSKPEETLPGVTLLFRSSNLREVGGKKVAEITAYARIENEDLWKQIEKLFQSGYRFYRDPSFKDEIVSVLREEVHQLQARITGLEQENERKTRELAFVREELEEKKGILDGFGRRLRG